MTRDFARRLRKNMTDAEQRLWWAVRYRQLSGWKFRRQAPIGKFIADFVCFEAKLIVELDGGQHAERVEEDAARTRWFESEGFRVLRFWNHDVLQDLDVVLEAIWQALGGCSPPTPTLPHKGGGSQTASPSPLEGVKPRLPPP